VCIFGILDKIANYSLRCLWKHLDKMLWSIMFQYLSHSYSTNTLYFINKAHSNNPTHTTLSADTLQLLPLGQSQWKKQIFVTAAVLYCLYQENEKVNKYIYPRILQEPDMTWTELFYWTKPASRVVLIFCFCVTFLLFFLWHVFGSFS